MSDISAKASNVLQTNGCLKVSSKSSPASVAGAIAGMMKDGVPVEIQSVGEYRTAIRFSVEPRVPVTSRDIAQSQSSEFE